MLSLSNKKIIFDAKRCCQCGACLAACDKGALHSSINSSGLYSIWIEHEKCDRCGHCVSVCPAHSLPNRKLSDDKWERLFATVLAYARDIEIRENASSGGVARVLLAGALEKGLAESAYSLRRIREYPWAEGHFWKAPVNLEEVPNSMYLPILAMKNLRLKRPLKSILLIGTTCQLLAGYRLVKGKVGKVYKIAIYCKQQKTLSLSKFVAERLGVHFATNREQNISYRGKGWPGMTTIENMSIAWEKIAALPYGKRLWRVPGCLCCPNPLGVNVDLTLADPWGIEKPGTAGKTLVMVWTDQGKELLESSDSLLFGDNVDIRDLQESLGWQALKRRQVMVDYYAGKKVPFRVLSTAVLEQIQTRIYEKVLENMKLPDILYKIMAHMPDIGKLA